MSPPPVGTENGHYGIPLTLLDRAHTTTNPPEALVIEIGIDEVGAMRRHAALVRPDIAVITIARRGAPPRAPRDERTAQFTRSSELLAERPSSRARPNEPPPRRSGAS